MARTYTKTKRAELEAETRQRIVEAAVDLHTTLGPAQTTISMIAERAGVQRHTVYAHFPDERTMLMACSGLSFERDPFPDPVAWETINDPSVRLREALAALYAWYDRNDELTGNVLRDAERHAPTRETVAYRFGPQVEAIANSVGDGLDDPGHAALRLAMSYHTWRTLVRDAGLASAEAIELMARTVLGEPK